VTRFWSMPASAKSLSEALRDAFRSAARFRNLVTYQTAVIQDDVVFRILQEHLSDFEGFLAAVAHWLEGRTEASPSGSD
jgi:uncharacterized protein YutE (UPF0331/DUF86 family)